MSKVRGTKRILNKKMKIQYSNILEYPKLYGVVILEFPIENLLKVSKLLVTQPYKNGSCWKLIDIHFFSNAIEELEM